MEKIDLSIPVNIMRDWTFCDVLRKSLQNVIDRGVGIPAAVNKTRKGMVYL